MPTGAITRPTALALMAMAVMSASVFASVPAPAMADPGSTTTQSTEQPPSPVSELTQPTSEAPGTGEPAPSTTDTTTTTTGAVEELPQVTAQHPQASGQGSSDNAKPHEPSTRTGGTSTRHGKPTDQHSEKAIKPSALTPPLPSSLAGSVSGVPDFFVNSFSIPPFLLPIYQAAGTAYGIPWQVLAAINEVETNYGRDLSISSAGAEGWMQFLPSSWAQYGVDATAEGYEDPYNPADAIFAAARYLKAAGGNHDIRGAIFAYNHSQAYVNSVMLRAQLLGGTPPGLLGAITGLTEARFPVHAVAHFSDGFPVIQTGPEGHSEQIPATTIYSQANAPVVAVQDGVITRVGHSRALGDYISLRDAFGNTYTYGQLGDLAKVYPVITVHGHGSAARPSKLTADPVPSGPASAGAQPSTTLSGAPASGGLGSEPLPQAQGTVLPPPSSPTLRHFRAGADEVYLHPLSTGVQVIAGTVLGHLAAGEGEGGEPHMIFQIRPSGPASPLIDPKPILDGWVLLEDTSAFRAKGSHPFATRQPSPGQALLESKHQLTQQVLANRSIRLYSCGRKDIQSGQIDRRVLAVMEFLSVSGMNPTVSALRCGHTPAPGRAASDYSAGEAVDISAINGEKIGPAARGSVTYSALHRLMGLQGTVRPLQITTPSTGFSASNTVGVHGLYTHIHISYRSPRSAGARIASLSGNILSASQWIKLITRLGQIPNPAVSDRPSTAAIPDPQSSTGVRGAADHG